MFQTKKTNPKSYSGKRKLNDRRKKRSLKFRTYRGKIKSKSLNKKAVYDNENFFLALL